MTKDFPEAANQLDSICLSKETLLPTWLSPPTAPPPARPSPQRARAGCGQACSGDHISRAPQAHRPVAKDLIRIGDDCRQQ